MVIYSHCHHLLGFFLTDNIFIQLCLDDMGRRYVLHGQDRLFLGFFLDFLLFGNFHCGRCHIQIIEVHVHVGHIGEF